MGSYETNHYTKETAMSKFLILVALIFLALVGLGALKTSVMKHIAS